MKEKDLQEFRAQLTDYEKKFSSDLLYVQKYYYEQLEINKGSTTTRIGNLEGLLREGISKIWSNRTRSFSRNANLKIIKFRPMNF